MSDRIALINALVAQSPFPVLSISAKFTNLDNGRSSSNDLDYVVDRFGVGAPKPFDGLGGHGYLPEERLGQQPQGVDGGSFERREEMDKEAGEGGG